MLEARTPEIEALVKAQWRPLARYAYRLLRDSGLAEDVVQESFCRYMNTSFSYGDEQLRIPVKKITHSGGKGSPVPKERDRLFRGNRIAWSLSERSDAGDSIVVGL